MVTPVLDTGAKSKEFEGTEPSWGFLAGDMGIDSGIGNGAAVLSLWKQLLLTGKDRSFFEEDLASSW